MREIVNMFEGRGTDERRDIIVGMLKDKGYEFSSQLFKKKDGHGINISVDIGDGGKDSRTYVLCANYDILPGSGGANDNASSLAVMMNLIDEFWDQGATNKLKFVFLDGSETGLEGAKHFVKENQEPLDSVINLKMVGQGNNFAIWPFYSNEEFEFIFALEAQIKKKEIPALRFPELLPNMDHEPFRKARIEAFSLSLMSELDMEPAMTFLQDWENNKKTQVENYLSESSLFQNRHASMDTADLVSEDSLMLVRDVIRDAIIDVDTERL